MRELEKLVSNDGIRSALRSWLAIKVDRWVYRRDSQNFNCATQDETAWHERTVVAADLIAEAIAADATLRSLADLGCGNQKLKSAIEQRGLILQYRGFDLAPQAPTVTRLDLQADNIPENFDVAALLGVIEYIPDVVAVLRKVKSHAPYLVVSHVGPELKKISKRARRELNWRTVLTRQEFEARLAEAGFTIMEFRITPDNFTRVWLCRAS